MAFVEPCCAETQIPRLIRTAGGHALFQTNGDVTIEKLMQAACCMASGGFGEYWIVVREADVVLLRMLAHWIDRGWIRRLHLLTEADQRMLVASELGDGRMRLCETGSREGLSSAQMFCCVGDGETVVVQGEMMLAASPTARVTAYSAAVGPNSRLLAPDGIAASLIENLRAILRVQKRKARKKADEGPGAVPSREAAAGGAPEGEARPSDHQSAGGE